MQDSHFHYLDRNAFIESFTANARNLIQFLSNDDKGNMKAADFIQDFKSEKNEVTRSFIQLSTQQTFHLGKARPTAMKGKFTTSDSPMIKDWIERGMENFLSRLSTEDKKLWNTEKADPMKEDVHPAYEGQIRVTSDPGASSANPQSASTGLPRKLQEKE
jgi:hypothetical protein